MDAVHVISTDPIEMMSILDGVCMCVLCLFVRWNKLTSIIGRSLIN